MPSSPPPTEPQSSSRTSSPIFSSSRSPSPSHITSQPSAASQVPRAPAPSDLPHLIRTHQTLGYRAGVSDGKDAAGSVQAAFDQGYPLGAQLGFRVGWLLGVIAEIHTDADGRQPKLEEAERELSVAALIAEMEGAGILTSRDVMNNQDVNVADGQSSSQAQVGGDMSWQAPTGFVNALPSVQKWASFVKDHLNSADAAT